MPAITVSPSALQVDAQPRPTTATATVAPSRLQPKPRHGDATNLYVGGLHSSIDDAELERRFRVFGTIVSAKVLLHIHTGESRGIGFVKFNNRNSSMAALQALHHTTMAGQRIAVRYADARADYHPGEKTNKIFVRNIPLDVKVSHIKSLLRSVAPVLDCTLHLDTAGFKAGGTGVRTRMAYVTFETEEQAVAAIGLLHGKRPFPSCHAALMAKHAESEAQRQARRRQELRLGVEQNTATSVSSDVKPTSPIGFESTWDGNSPSTPGDITTSDPDKRSSDSSDDRKNGSSTDDDTETSYMRRDGQRLAPCNAPLQLAAPAIASATATPGPDASYTVQPPPSYAPQGVLSAPGAPPSQPMIITSPAAFHPWLYQPQALPAPGTMLPPQPSPFAVPATLSGSQPHAPWMGPWTTSGGNASSGSVAISPATVPGHPPTFAFAAPGHHFPVRHVTGS